MPVKFLGKKRWRDRRESQPKRASDVRTEFARDKSRLIHSAAFRRLQAKTQVLGIGESDFHRTRLTHTMEVAQIGDGIVDQLSKRKKSHKFKSILPPYPLIQSICFVHDLGHPPFGHSGEIALNYAMREHGGFEGNGQSLRIVAALEPLLPGFGLNLTRRTLLGILKYPAPYEKVCRTQLPSILKYPGSKWKPPKCYLGTEIDVVDWIFDPLSLDDRQQFEALAQQPNADSPGKTRHKSFDASILELADDIAYGVHDLEDGISLRLISSEQFFDVVTPELVEWAKPFGILHDQLFDKLFGPESRQGDRKWAIGAFVNALIASVEIDEAGNFECPLLRYRVRIVPPATRFLDALKLLTRKHIVKTQEVQTIEFRGRKLLTELFEVMVANPDDLLGESYRRRIDQGHHVYRVVCDFIAGMTDVYAARFYERVLGTRQTSLFERL